MKNLLFYGIDINSKQKIFGYFFWDGISERSYIRSMYPWSSGEIAHEIEKDSERMFTGRVLKNGTKLFEGDWVRTNVYGVVNKTKAYQIRWSDMVNGFVLYDPDGFCGHNKPKGCFEYGNSMKISRAVALADQQK